MSESYLIAHKVRGEAAFDVAIKFDFGDEEGWLIPTSGHRAYPYWSMAIEALWSYVPADYFIYGAPNSPPTDLPDHYSCNDKPASLAIDAVDVLRSLGLVPRIDRRI